MSLCLLAVWGCAPGQSSGSFGARYLGGGTFRGCNPVLSPDGESLVCALPRAGAVGNIYSLPIETGHVRRIRESKFYLGFPDVSPDGRMIVYIAEPSGVPEVWIADISGENARRLTKSAFPEETPVFSGDGRSIAFVRRTSLADHSNLSSELFMIGIDGKSERRMTDDRCVDSPVRFSSDGAGLYFVSERSWEDVTLSDERAHLFRLSLDTLSIEPVLRLNLNAASGCCDLSMDEKTVVFVDAPKNDFAYDVFTCNLDGSNRQKRTMLGSYIGSVRFGFHSQRFSYVEQRAGYGPPKMYVYDIDSSSAQKVALPEE